VRLDMSFRCGHPPYNALAEHAYAEPIPFTPTARRRYRLQLPDQPPPYRAREDALDLGTAVLYRTDPPAPPRPATAPEEREQPETPEGAGGAEAATATGG